MLLALQIVTSYRYSLFPSVPPIDNALRIRWEIGLLAALAFVIPLFEASKNILWFGYLALWLFNRIRDKDFGGTWNRWDTLFLIVIVSPFIGSLFAGIRANEWGGARDVARYGLLGWALSRTRYDEPAWRRIAVMAVAGVLAGLLLAWWALYAGKKVELELHSVGHVNHSAAYLVITLGVVLAMLFGRWRESKSGEKLSKVLVIGVLGAAIVYTASRIAVGVAALLLFGSAALFIRRSCKPLLVVLLIFAVGAVIAKFEPPQVIQKHWRDVTQHNFLAYRDLIWERAWVAWREFPVFGVGADNFSQIDSNRYKTWHEHQGRRYEPARDFGTSHAHSLYFNTLAERGLLGLLALGLLLTGWGCSLWRRRPRDDVVLQGTVWLASLGGWVTIMVIGLFNTILQTENALFAMLLLGAWLGVSDKPKSQSTT